MDCLPHFRNKRIICTADTVHREKSRERVRCKSRKRGFGFLLWRQAQSAKRDKKLGSLADATRGRNRQALAPASISSATGDEPYFKETSERGPSVCETLYPELHLYQALDLCQNSSAAELVFAALSTVSLHPKQVY